MPFIREFFFLNCDLFLFGGLVFFVLGLAIALQSRRYSRLELARSLSWLAAFGITHGLQEWGDLFIPIQRTYMSQAGIVGLALLQLVLLGGSFACLFQFGVALLRPAGRARWLHGLSAGVFVAWLFVIFFLLLPLQPDLTTWHHLANALARYFIGFPGGLLAALTVTRSLTRDLLLELVDQHSILMYEIAGRLNTILDLQDALREVSDLMRVAMGVDKWEVILEERFGQLGELGFPTSIARQAIEQRSVIMIPDLSAQADPAPGKSALLLGIRSVLCVPVLLEQVVVALLYVYKTNPAARPFDQHDVQLAVAISHQAALTIQRAQLLERARAFEQRATTDSLTGLHNRQQILELAEREFQRARRLRHPLATLMVDTLMVDTLMVDTLMVDADGGRADGGRVSAK